MSDGPHRSLPMRRGWQRVAESAANEAFGPDEIRDAIEPALEQDCRGEMTREFIDRFQNVCADHASSLFKDDLAASLEALRKDAGPGLGRTVLDYAIKAESNGGYVGELPEKALKDAIVNRGARGIWQVEEHYIRKTTIPRANRVRERIEQAIGNADIDGVVRRVLDPKAKPVTHAPKRQGVDEGVKL
jgi:hypothetical protein